ncbi:hypothetical protein EVG20_g10103 [Dentipellis fragilis]|uniref:MoaB/Mog domain-containing protein n=1 Tax=Dentipellis fragilis TaxID=205917 RepID=A0A4Y9XTT6_9AGAM|nr:hypothetical protein EVG20_g10103 [Dentipellis fragilis]
MRASPSTPTLRILSFSRHLRPATSLRFATMSTSTASAPVPDVNFELSPIPKNPLGEGRYIKTAAALMIGDEILNGKTLDRNSNYFAKFCFENGIDLKRIEVVPDDEEDIAEASQRMVQKYDFVITSGGIGPTHDDITYESLAKAFNQSLVHHTETLNRMLEMSKSRPWIAQQNEEQKKARERMALFPEKAEVLYIGKDIWVPVVRLEGKLCIFPGIPGLFQKMLDGLKAFLPLPPASEQPFRQQIFTQLPESSIAPYLTELHQRVKKEGIRVGSYPLLLKGVYVSLIGLDEKRVRELGDEVQREVQGKLVTEEECDQSRCMRRVVSFTFSIVHHHVLPSRRLCLLRRGDAEMQDETGGQSMSQAPPQQPLFFPQTPSAAGTPQRPRGSDDLVSSPLASAVARRAVGMSTPRRTPRTPRAAKTPLFDPASSSPAHYPTSSPAKSNANVMDSDPLDFPSS